MANSIYNNYKELSKIGYNSYMKYRKPLNKGPQEIRAPLEIFCGSYPNVKNKSPPKKK